MASGRLGTADLAATTNTTLYTVPANTFSVLTVSICNRGTTSVTIRIAVAVTSTPGNDEWYEYDTVVPAKGVFERTGLVVDATKKVIVYSSGASVTAIAHGIETSTV